MTLLQQYARHNNYSESLNIFEAMENKKVAQNINSVTRGCQQVLLWRRLSVSLSMRS